MATDRFNGVVASLAIKVRCVLGAEANVATLSGAQTIESVAVTAGDRVLLTAQTDPIENGAWDVQDPGPWTRSADWDGNRDVEKGSTVWAGRNGQDDKLWQVQTDGTILPGNTAQTITELFNPAAPGASSLQDVTDIGAVTTNSIQLNGGSLLIVESTLPPDVSAATIGQVWVRDDAPNVLMFTDDTGGDFQLSSVAGVLPVGTVDDSPLVWADPAWVENTSVRLGPSNIKILESAAAAADELTYGQFWVRDDQTPMFTDELGTDFALNSGGAVIDQHTYQFDTNTGQFDPGTGYFRFNSATPASITALVIADTRTDGTNIDADVLANMVLGSQLRFVKADDLSVFLTFTVTSITDLTDFYALSVSYKSGSAIPALDDEVIVEIQTAVPYFDITGLSSDGSLFIYDTTLDSYVSTFGRGRIDHPAVGETRLHTSDSILRLDSASRIQSSQSMYLSFLSTTDALIMGADGGHYSIGTGSTSNKNLDLWADNGGQAVRVKGGSTLMIGERAGALADILTYGQIWVNSADDSLNYQTEAGVNFVLNSPGGALPASTAASNTLIGDGSGGWVENNVIQLTDAGAAGQIIVQGLGSSALTSAPFHAAFTVGNRYLISATSPDDSDTLGIEWALSSSDGNERVNFNWGTFSGGVRAISFVGGDVTFCNDQSAFQAGSLFLSEVGSALADRTGWGQFWVRNDANQTPMFTDEAGVDYELNGGGSPFATPLRILGDTDAEDHISQLEFRDNSDTQDRASIGFDTAHAASGVLVIVNDIAHTAGDQFYELQGSNVSGTPYISYTAQSDRHSFYTGDTPATRQFDVTANVAALYGNAGGTSVSGQRFALQSAGVTKGTFGFRDAAGTLEIFNDVSGGDLFLGVNGNGGQDVDLIRMYGTQAAAAVALELRWGSGGFGEDTVAHTRRLADGGFMLNNTYTGTGFERAVGVSDRAVLSDWWQYDSFVGGTPPSNNFRMDNAALASVTSIDVNDTALSGYDFGSFFGAILNAGDTLYMRTADDPTRYAIYTIDAITDTTGEWAIDVTHVESGTQFTDNDRIAFEFVPASGGSGTVTSSGSPLANEIAIFTGATDIDSNANFTYDGTQVDFTATVTAGFSIRGPSSQLRVHDSNSTGDANDYLSLDVQDDIGFIGGTDVSGAGFKGIANIDFVTGIVRLGNSGAEVIMNNHTRLEDSAQLRFGDLAGGDFSFAWDGTNMVANNEAGAGAFQFTNGPVHVRDGEALALYDSTNNDNVNFIVDAATSNLIVEQTGVSNIRLDDIHLLFDDSQELRMGSATAGDFRMYFDGTNLLMDSVTGSFDIQLTDLDLNMQDNDIIRPVLVDYAIESSPDDVSGTTVTFTYSDGPVFECDMEAATGNVTATLSGGPPAGTYGQITVKMTQDTTVRTLTWAGGTFRWAGGTAHPVTTTANGFSIYTFETWDGGTTWYGAGADYS